MRLAGVGVGVGGHEDLRLDLTESIQDALGAEVRRARGPHGADRRRAERADDALRQVGHETRDAIARLDARVQQCAGERNDPGIQLAPRQRPVPPRLVAIDDGRLTVPATKQVLGEVQPCVREEARARHPLGMLEDTVAAFADDAGEVPHGPPEVGRAIDRELVERSVVGDRRSVFLADIPHEPREVGVGHTLARRRPEWLCHITKNTLRF